MVAPQEAFQALHRVRAAKILRERIMDYMKEVKSRNIYVSIAAIRVPVFHHLLRVRAVKAQTKGIIRLFN